MQLPTTNSSASSSLSSTSPSISSYSSRKLADIAARVVHELKLSHDDDPFIDFHQDDVINPENDANNITNNDDEIEFEFVVLRSEDTSAVTADDIFYDGKIKPIYYPIFNTNLINNAYKNDIVSSNGDDNDELDRVPQDTYCTWSPKKGEDDKLVLKKKSNSTGLVSGLPKRWRFKDLLHKSHSDGKDTFVFLTSSHQYKSSNDHKRGKVITGVNVNVNASYYGYNGGKKLEGVKKKSYLPYREELLGVFSYVNAFH